MFNVIRGLGQKLLALFMLSFAFVLCHADDVNTYYAIYKSAKFQYPVEKEFIANLKSPNPDNPRAGGYIKFRATLLFDDKGVDKELDAKIDVVRHIILNTVNGFSGIDLQGATGRAKLAGVLTSSINAILTGGKISGVAFGDFVMQL